MFLLISELQLNVSSHRFIHAIRIIQVEILSPSKWVSTKIKNYFYFIHLYGSGFSFIKIDTTYYIFLFKNETYSPNKR